jgi:hypothetical protein
VYFYECSRSPAHPPWIVSESNFAMRVNKMPVVFFIKMSVGMEIFNLPKHNLLSVKFLFGRS